MDEFDFPAAACSATSANFTYAAAATVEVKLESRVQVRIVLLNAGH